jgi:hypothetical protein
MRITHGGTGVKARRAPVSEYGDGMLCGALPEIDGKRGVRDYQLPTG